MLDYRKTYTLPFQFEIPNYTKEYLNNKSIIKSWIKFFKRYLFIVVKGQRKLEVFSILPKHQNILWINISAPSLGDSLMDLSSRVLLKNKKVDLFIDKKNVHLIVRENKEGLDTAHKMAYEYAVKNKYDNLITSDADLSHDPKVLGDFAATIHLA